MALRSGDDWLGPGSARTKNLIADFRLELPSLRLRDNEQTTKTGVVRLLVYDLDLLVDHLTGEPVDRDVDPVVLFPFHDEIVLKTSGIWLVVT